MASIDRLDEIYKKIAEIREAIAWRERSLARVNPKYKDNQAYITRLNNEIIELKQQLASLEATIKTDFSKKTVTAKSDPALASPNLPTETAINPETGEPYQRLIQPQKEPSQTESTNSEVDPTRYEAEMIAEQRKIDIESDPARYEAELMAEELKRQQEQEALEAQAELLRESRRGLSGNINNTRQQASIQDTLNFNQLPDWRVKLKLAPNSGNYLYKATNPGILAPLQSTDGVIFPYMPIIQLGYTASYDAFDVVHSNYKIFQYKNSAVEQISLTADFTCQDANEAAYALAVIHFFRSVTKMFYGNDQNPIAGTPPPLCYLYGLGDFQFNQHPLVISSFTYTLPTDVDYIRAGAPTLVSGQTAAPYNTPNNSPSVSNTRMQASNVPIGGKSNPPNWVTKTNIEPTYVPTKFQIAITALPIITRKDITDNFSVKEYATGSLLRGSQNSRGGIW